MTIFPHRCFWNVHHVTSQYNQLRCVKQISSMYVPEGKLNTLCINCINCVWTSWAFIYKQQIWLWWGCLFFFCILPRGLGMVCNVDFAHSCGAGAAVASLNIWWGEGERGYEHIIFAAHSSSCRKISFTSLYFKKDKPTIAMCRAEKLMGWWGQKIPLQMWEKFAKITCEVHFQGQIVWSSTFVQRV